MNESEIQALKHTALTHSVKLLALLGLLITFVPLKLTGIHQIMPSLEILILFYWAIYRPNLLPIWFLFILGIIADSVMGTPLGASALTYIILYSILKKYRRLLGVETFMIIWGMCMAIMLPTILAKWFFISLFMGRFELSEALIFQWLLTIITYPVIHEISRRIYTALSNSSQHA